MAALKSIFVVKMKCVSEKVVVLKFWVGVTNCTYGIYPTERLPLRVLGEILLTFLVK